MAHETTNRKAAAGGRRVLAAVILVAVLAAGALARSRSRETPRQDSAAVTPCEARALLSNDGAWNRVAGGPPMSALSYPHSR